MGAEGEGAETEKEERKVSFVPDVISFTVGFPVPNKAGTSLVQILVTFRTLQTCRVPFQIRRNSENILVVDLIAATDA